VLPIIGYLWQLFRAEQVPVDPTHVLKCACRNSDNPFTELYFHGTLFMPI